METPLRLQGYGVTCMRRWPNMGAIYSALMYDEERTVVVVVGGGQATPLSSLT